MRPVEKLTWEIAPTHIEEVEPVARTLTEKQLFEAFQARYDYKIGKGVSKYNLSAYFSKEVLDSPIMMSYETDSNIGQEYHLELHNCASFNSRVYATIAETWGDGYRIHKVTAEGSGGSIIIVKDEIVN
jgi:hypothetical protein